MEDSENREKDTDTMTKLVADQLRDLILSGALQPGERVTQTAVAKRLKVSRTPVREAIRILASEGMIEETPHRGATVSQTAPAEVRNIYHVRTILETHAVAASTPLIPDTELQEIVGLLDAVAEELAAGRSELFVKSDVAVHGLFLNHCGNPYLVQVLDGITDRIRAVRAHEADQDGEQLQESHREHVRIIEAALRRNPADAQRHMQAHLEAARERVVRLFQGPRTGKGVLFHSQRPVPSRDYITARVADLRKISTPEGLEILEPVVIGGTRQWVSIRGLNRANPVLLVIHGGPGTPMMPASWAFQTPWEDFFTVVQWDQRGVGKNYLESDLAALAPTMNLERMIDDAVEVVAHLRQRLKKDKIVVMGCSWGSRLGVHLAQRRPEWLHAYVGVGQVVGAESERHLHSRTLELARKDRNQEAIRELEAISPYPRPDGALPLASVLTTRKWARFYGGGWYGRTNLDLFFSLRDWAPEYTEADLDAQTRASLWAVEQLLPVLEQGDLREQARHLEVPVLIFHGRHDLHVPYEPAREYFELIQAPHKKLITFERSATFPMLEEAGRFLLALVNEVLPLTGEHVSFEPPAC